MAPVTAPPRTETAPERGPQTPPQRGLPRDPVSGMPIQRGMHPLVVLALSMLAASVAVAVLVLALLAAFPPL